MTGPLRDFPENPLRPENSAEQKQPQSGRLLLQEARTARANDTAEASSAR